MTVSGLPHNGIWYETKCGEAKEALDKEVDELDNSIRDTFVSCEPGPTTGQNWAYVCLVLGSLFVGATWETVLVVLLGSGGDGKSTLLSLMHAVLGAFALKAGETAFLRKGGSKFANRTSVDERRAYKGKRLMYLSDAGSDKVPTEHIKQVTSNQDADALTVGKDTIRRSWGPIVFATNKVLPFESSDGDNKAMERRTVTLLTKPPKKDMLDFATVYNGEKKHVFLEWCIRQAEKYFEYNQKGKVLGNPDVLQNGLKSDMPHFFRKVSMAYITPKKALFDALSEHFALGQGSAGMDDIRTAYKQQVPHELLMRTEPKWLRSMVIEWAGGVEKVNFDRRFYGMMKKKKREGSGSVVSEPVPKRQCVPRDSGESESTVA